MTQASSEKLEHTGSAKKERVASVPQRERAVGKTSLPKATPKPSLPKGKGTEPIRVLGTDKRSVMMIKVKFNSKSELVENREGK